jgi:hypothetical protein
MQEATFTPSSVLSPPAYAIRWRWLILAALLLAILAEINGNLLGLGWLSATSPHLQFLMLCAAIVCLIITFPNTSLVKGTVTKLRPQSLVLSPVFWITLLALLIRLWHNSDAIRVLVDEMNFLSGMTNFWKPDPIGILTPMDNISPFTWLFPYWQANFVALFGRNLGALRAVSAVVGALNIPALYLLAATLFNRRVALVAAFLLAVFPPHIHFSRIALLSITDPLLGTLVLAFLARGLQGGRPRDFALAGIFLGLTQYFFEGGRLLYIPLAAVWIIACWLLTPMDVSVGTRRALSLRGIGYTILCTALLAAPVYYTLLAIQKPLTGRMDASGLGTNFAEQIAAAPLEGGLNYLVNHLSPAIRIYALLPDQTRYYGGDTALLLPFVVPFFLLGLLTMLRHMRSPGHLLLLLWLLAVSFGNSLLKVSAASTRYVVVFPGLALITALGLCAFVDWLWKQFLSYHPSNLTPEMGTESSNTGNWRLATGNLLITRHSLLVTILVVLAFYQLVYYFGPHLGSFDANFRETRPNHDIEDAVYRSLDFPAGTQVHIIGRGRFDVGYGTKFAAFFRDDLPTDGYISADLNAETLAVLPRGVDQVFFFESLDVETLTLLQSTFKSALEGPFFSPYNVAPERQFVMFIVRRSP